MLRGRRARTQKGDTTDITAGTGTELESILEDRGRESIIANDGTGPGPGQPVEKDGLEMEERIKHLQKQMLSAIAAAAAHLAGGEKTETIGIDEMVVTDGGNHGSEGRIAWKGWNLSKVTQQRSRSIHPGPCTEDLPTG